VIKISFNVKLAIWL